MSSAARVAVAVALACGACATTSAPPKATPPAGLVEGGTDAGPAGDEVPSLDALAATEMPLMREVLRLRELTKPAEIVPAADGCFRAVVAASIPVHAWFEDASHVPRGDVTPPAERTDAGIAAARLVPARGPACARKGEVLRLVIAPVTTTLVARAVVWQSG